MINKTTRNIASCKAETKLHTRATAQLQAEVKQELKVKDSSLAELINDETASESKDIRNESGSSEGSKDSDPADGEDAGDA